MSQTASPSTNAPVAHKFGGSSLRDADRIGHVADVLLGRDEPRQVVVVSAMQGVTDALIELGQLAADRSPAWRNRLGDLRTRHLDTSAALLGADHPHHAWLDEQFDMLADVLHALAVVGSPSPDTMAFVQGLGEVFCAHLLTAVLAHRGGDSRCLDAREVLVVSHEELGVAVEWAGSRERLARWRADHDAPIVVATGFVARDREDRVTTLGRNGSDYSCAIFAALFDAGEIHIWTDVDGVLSADPRVVPEAILLDSLSYDEACELAYFGAKVIHPQTMAPAIARGIPLTIRNTMRPEHPGTRIADRTTAARTDTPVAGITTIGGMAIVNVEGAGMIGVPGTAERVFGALHHAGISVVMISQGSSEHSICCVVDQQTAAHAVTVLEEAFARELGRGQIQAVAATPGVSVLAAVGDGMAGTPGIAARMFEALGKSRINIRAIAQGASERNISVAVAEADAARALRAVHAGFYLSAQTLSVGLVGPGQVGAALLDQLAAAAARLHERTHLDLRVRGIASSRRMLLCDRGIELDNWRERFTAESVAFDAAAFTAHVHAAHLPHALMIDCTASPAVADLYAGWLQAGVHVITPNKHAGAGEFARYAAIRSAASATGARFRFEATCGAGLPILGTLQDLVDTGDEVLAIAGILSGTLGYLFQRFDGSRPFSELVAEARAAGLTEPDPREDLSGNDVARKLVILGRELGRELELDDVQVEGLVPDALRGVDQHTFLARLAELDAPMQQRLAAAAARGKILRYVAHLDRDGHPTVGLTELDHDHAFASVRPTDNVVQFTTRRYLDNPLVVQGPGAGPEVTAAGVFADLLRVAAALGARV
ncbi:MAG: bifunctional aspartate kinase/homoserine dehydrogenase I [bacterium]|nr:bifunctional aspartate kinase/homoserine dehydrogenase I [bacterium]